jgi:hypothetical protein
MATFRFEANHLKNFGLDGTFKFLLDIGIL